MRLPFLLAAFLLPGLPMASQSTTSIARLAPLFQAKVPDAIIGSPPTVSSGEQVFGTAATSLTITAVPAVVAPGALITFTVEVEGPTSVPAPTDGIVRVEADTGESCQSTTPSSSMGSTATHQCVLSLSTLGYHSVTATFEDSSTHEDSAPSITSVLVGTLADIEVSASSSTSGAFAGGTMSHQVAVANAGPNAAPSVQFVVIIDPPPTSLSWTCRAFGTASCPASSGTGEIAVLLNLPAGSSLLFNLTSVLPEDLASSVILLAVAGLDPQSPDFVADPNPSNNEVLREVEEGVFRDGFDEE